MPPAGYGGIEWVVALLSNGLTARGHDVTLFAPPGSRTEAELVVPLDKLPPEDMIGDPWHEASHVISAYQQSGEFDFREAKEDFLLFLGRADEEKAPHLAIEAARQAGRRLVMCVTTKNEREQTYWAECVEPLLSDDVEVLGECDQDQKADLLARAAALVFPIQWAEPFGLVMIEAMACGTPVLAWRNGSVPEVVDDGVTGFVVASTEELARAVDRVGELDPGTIRARVEERFSAPTMVAGYERAYERVLASRESA